MKNNALGILFASDEDSHLNDLTIHRTTASLPYAGRYRLIDFVLSNMVHANITKIGIITRNNYNSLMDHIRQGRDWDLNRKNSGISVYPPFVFNAAHEVYKGKIEALYMLRGFMLKSSEDYVVISNANIAFNIDFEEVEKFHVERGADITMLTYSTEDVTPRKLVVTADKNKRIKDLRYPVSTDTGKQLCNLNIYYVKKDLLISLIDNAYAHGAYDFEKDILRASLDELYVMSYEVDNYVAVIDRIPTYFKRSMDLLNPEVREDLFYNHSTILTKVKDSVPTRYRDGANVKNSLIADGCDINGTVINSILFRGVKVEAGAVIENSIVMEGGKVCSGAKMSYIIADKDVTITEDKKISGYETYPMVIVKGKTV